MARPVSENAPFFKHDNDMRNDPKIRAIRAKFGFVGYGVYNMMLETLCYTAGFRVEWDDLSVELFAGDFGLPSDDFKEVIEYCVKVKLFDFERGKLLCPSLETRLAAMIQKRAYDADNKRQLRKDGIVAATTQKNMIVAATIPQEEEEEEEEKIIEKEKSANDIFSGSKEKKIEAPPSSGPPPPNSINELDEWVKELPADHQHLDQWSMAKGFPKGELIKLLPRFLAESGANDRASWPVYGEFRRHFFNWAALEKSKSNAPPKNLNTNAKPRTGAPVATFEPGARVIGRP